MNMIMSTHTHTLYISKNKTPRSCNITTTNGNAPPFTTGTAPVSHHQFMIYLLKLVRSCERKRVELADRTGRGSGCEDFAGFMTCLVSLWSSSGFAAWLQAKYWSIAVSLALVLLYATKSMNLLRLYDVDTQLVTCYRTFSPDGNSQARKL